MGTKKPSKPRAAKNPKSHSARKRAAKAAKPQQPAEPPVAAAVQLPPEGTKPSKPAKPQKGAEVVDLASRAPKADTAGEGGKGAEFYQDLACTLTDAEVAKKADELAKATSRHRELEDEKREYANRTRAELKGLQGSAEALAAQVSARSEERPVRCRRVQDAERFKVAVFRTDTDECLDVRDMTEEEAERARQRPPAQLGKDVIAAIREWDAQRARFAKEKTGKTMAEMTSADIKRAKGGGDFNLRDIPGVGAKVATALQEHGFGTIQSIRDAVEADLVKVPGVGSLLAQRILLYVEENYGAGAPATATEPPPEVVDRVEKAIAELPPQGPRGKEAVEQAASNLRAAAAQDEEPEEYEDKMAREAGEAPKKPARRYVDEKGNDVTERVEGLQAGEGEGAEGAEEKEVADEDDAFDRIFNEE
jgi:predicted flap endonuclease-1-like 5' DNA nuclease